MARDCRVGRATSSHVAFINVVNRAQGTAQHQKQRLKHNNKCKVPRGRGFGQQVKFSRQPEQKHQDKPRQKQRDSTKFSCDEIQQEKRCHGKTQSDNLKDFFFSRQGYLP
ncbi:hypothetical protein [Roseovarius aestuarii]|uniref:hypothetical protein n=1 Tax=Roseovarius aestuarii TaxID=475083 RepID=UPI00111BE827|nr:hypothetical protein [Roseovarius aestuarii]